MFFVESAKNYKFGYLRTPFWGKLGMMHDLRWWLVGKPMHGQLSICVNWTFSLSITVPELWGEICIVRLFTQQGRPLYTQIFSWQGRPQSPVLGTRKLEALGYPMVKAASVCVPSFWHCSECDGQTNTGTDRRICGSIYSASGLGFCQQKPVSARHVV